MIADNQKWLSNLYIGFVIVFTAFIVYGVVYGIEDAFQDSNSPFQQQQIFNLYHG